MKVRVRKRTAAIVTGALVLAGVTTAVVISSGTASRKPAPQATGPIQGQVHSIGLRGNGTTAAVSAPSTAPFSMLGVAWNEATAHLVGSVKVRTRSRSTGAWSAWRPVTVDNDDTPDGTHERSRQGATSPLWTGPSNGVDVRVAGRRTLPAGLRVMLIDPGRKHQQQVRADGHQPVRVALAADITDDPTATPTDSASETPSDSPSATSSDTPTETPSSTPRDTSAPAPTPTATTPVPSTAPRPTIVSRAGWGADESLVKGAPSYGDEVKVVFVHHTDTGNDYSCSESAAVVRSVMLYHVNVDGWDDIGYNFLVDKCGKLFEGRAGGVDRPVIGAHAYGFNTNSAGVAVLGTYANSQEAKGGVAPTQAALDTVAKVAAWKLGLSGRNPTGSDTLVEGVKDGNFPYNSNVTFKRISGHRNANSTACPGQYLYDKLGTIRTEADWWSTPADLTSLVPSTSTTTKVGSTYYTKGAVSFSWRAAAVKGWDLLDNGTVISHLSESATSVATTLKAGTHKLQLRATNINGTTAQSPVFTVVADTTKPVFSSSAALALRTGTVSASQVPVSLTWKARDSGLLQSVKATKPSAKTFAATTTSWSAYAHPSTSTLWSLTAADAAGNTATSSVTRTAWIKNESSATRTGVWTTASASGYLGGKALSSTKLGATASWTITGRSVGLITKRATNTGKFSVYVDGVYAGSVDTKSSSSLYRQIQWTKTWSTSGRHTIKIRVAATSGRPTVAIDGIAYIG